MSLGRSLYFSSMSSVLKLIIQFGLSIFVARMLTPEELGAFGVAIAATALVRAFESAGINNFVASYADLNQPMLRSVFTANLILNVTLSLILWALAYPFSVFYGSPQIKDIMYLLALATALNTHLPIMNGLLRREMRFKAFMALEQSALFVSALVTVGAVISGYGALSLAMAIVSERLVTALIGTIAFQKSIPMVPRFKDIKTVINYGFSLSAAVIIGMIGSQSNNFILGKLLGLAPSAQFDRAYTLPRLISQVGQMSFHNVLVPEIARQHKSGNPITPVISEVMTLYAIIVWPAGAVITVVAPEIILTLFGSAWEPAALISPYFLVYSLLASPVALACSALVALGHGGALVRNQLAQQITKVAVLMLAFFLSLQWIATLMVIPMISYLAVSTSQLAKLGYISRLEIAKALLRPLRMTLLSTIPVLIFKITETTPSYLSLTSLVVIAFLSTATYLLGMFVWERETLEKAIKVIGFSK